MPQFKSLRFLITLLVSQSILWTTPCLAADSPPLAAKPKTLRKMYRPGGVKDYILNQQGIVEAGNRKDVIENRMENPQEHPYLMGASVGELLENELKDEVEIFTSIGELLECLDYAIVGLCMHMTWTGPKFDLMREYRIPELKAETSSIKNVSGYLPELVMSNAAEITDRLFYGISSWPARKNAVIAMNTAWIASQTNGLKYGYLFGPTENHLAAIEADDFERIRSGAYADLKVRSGDNWRPGQGVRQMEYHIYPVLSHVKALYENLVIMGTCHFDKNPSIYFSDWIQGMAYSRFSGLSALHFGNEYSNKLLNPSACTQYNMEYGDTPSDMLLPLRHITGYSEDGCLGGNQQNVAPVTNIVGQAYHTTASEVASRRGYELVHRRSTSRYVKFDDTDSRDDRIEWLHSSRMEDARPGCRKLNETFARQYTADKANYYDRGEDVWNVNVMYNRYRCCRGTVVACWGENGCDKVYN